VAQDARWAPWIGCWELVDESARETALERLRSDRRPPDAVTPAAAPRVCVERDGDAAVTLTTTVPGQEPSTQTIRPDGVPHPLVEDGCRGTETAEWSRNGQRLFARAEVTCADGAPRMISGLAFLTPDDVWLDIRSFRIDSQPVTRVSRYRRASGAAPRRIPLAGGSPFTLAEIKEASGKVSDAVLEVALAEAQPFVPIDKHTLVDLADAGVAPSVIDVLVALAYPERFVIDRTPGTVAASAIQGPGHPFGLYDYYYSGYYYPAYYYSPFGYSYIGYYDPFFFRPIGYYGGRRGDRDERPSGTSYVIAGEGYTRIRPAGGGDGGDADAAVPRTAVRRAIAGGDGGGSAASAPVRSSDGGSSGSGSSGSSGSTASPAGYSSGGGGGGGDGGGRTAQPR
jgi:hypothetical protein